MPEVSNLDKLDVPKFCHQTSRSKVDADEDHFLNTYKGTVFKYAEEAQAGRITPMLFDFLAVIDTAHNGELSAEEIDEAADIIRIAKKGKEENSADLNYKHLPDVVAKVLTTWDADKSGSVSVTELIMAAEAQKKMRDENRLVKKLLVCAVLAIIILMAGTFALSFTAVEMAKETKADQDSGIVTTASGKPAGIGTAIDHISLVDFPSQSMEKLKELRDFSYVHNDVIHHRMVAGFNWHSETMMELITSQGEVFTIDDGTLTVRTPDGQIVTLDPEDGRRLNMFAGALLTSGSFTMMASSAF